MSTSTRGPVRFAALASILSLVLLAGCASHADRVDAGASTPPTPPPAGDLVKTRHAATVIEAGDTGVQLCVGAVLTSYPPQCGGPALTDWDWSKWSESSEQAGDVRWGEFALTGTYDADAFTFTPVSVEPWRSDMLVEQDEPAASLVSPCPAPDGGWRVLDAARTTDATLQQTVERARELDGFAEVWVDRSQVPTAGANATPEQQLAETAPFPELTILNVRVTGDVSAAEAQLRETWGGMLCVSHGSRSQAQLQAIGDELVAELTPDGAVLGVGVDGLAGTVYLTVIHDDGTLQKQMDDEYGVGWVTVFSQLESVG